jgi:hypothetical protein
VFDLAKASKGEGQLVVAGWCRRGRYANTQYKIARRVRDSIAGNASAADLKMMQDGGFSVYVAGTATKGGVMKSFAWGFATSTSLRGVRVAGGDRGGPAGRGADHGARRPPVVRRPVLGDAELRFGLIAQADDDGDANGEVSQAELEAVDLRPLANYQVGSTDIVDLWHFIEHQTTTLGHIDGEGHCETIREGRRSRIFALKNDCGDRCGVAAVASAQVIRPEGRDQPLGSHAGCGRTGRGSRGSSILPSSIQILQR